MTRNKFLEKARLIHGYKYQYPNLEENIMQMDIIDVLFNGVIYHQRVVKHFDGRQPERKVSKKTTDQFISEAKSVWGDKYDYSLVIYENSRTKVKIIYDGITYEQYPNGHLQEYPVEGYLNQTIFIEKSIKKWGDKYDYSLVNFKGPRIKVKILLDGIIYEQSPYNHLKYAPEKRNRRTNGEFVEESNIIHDNKYNYSKTIYTLSTKKVIITCPLHGDFSQLPSRHLVSGCSKCIESKAGKEIMKFLKKYDVKYHRQHKFKYRNQLPFDFYIPSIRTCIEFDDDRHFNPNISYESIKNNDRIKNNYCDQEYINLIRIRYDQFDDIYNILWENFKNTSLINNIS